ncbi:MAG TPA: hypothetical protein VMB48_06275 [Steroidobacteraceae bacterium]|nr:hypothetical protein [Steroidobacteraceae bacterium]
MRSMPVWLLVWGLGVAGCGTPHAVKVNCGGPLRPINVRPADAPLAGLGVPAQARDRRQVPQPGAARGEGVLPDRDLAPGPRDALVQESAGER